MEVTIEQVRKAYEPELLATEGVVGVGHVGDRIRIYVEGTPEFPDNIAGYPTEIVKVGHIKALPLLVQQEYVSLETDRTGRVRPCPGGMSCGSYKITAGTLGMAIEIGGKFYGLSNNHVLAAGDSVQRPAASIGDEILAPGAYDGGTIENDLIGRLFSWVPIDQVNDNLVDMAIFEPVNQEDLSREILEVGEPTGFGQAYVGERIRKSGRTSSLSMGIVQDIDATITVDYGDFEATFVHQIMTSFLADPGDSGSALIDEASPRVIGLLYSGCYDDETEILTENGFKLFSMLTYDDRVASLDPATGNFTYEYPLRLFKYPYNGPMVHFLAQLHVDLLVTPNHRMYVRTPTHAQRVKVNHWVFRPASVTGIHNAVKRNGSWDGKEQEFFTLPSCTSYQSHRTCMDNNGQLLMLGTQIPGLQIPMDDWLAYFGLWLAEGHTNRTYYTSAISQMDEDKIKRIKPMLDRLPFRWFKNGHQFKFTNKQLYEYLAPFGKTENKFVPNEIKALSPRQLRILLDWYCLGDGMIRDGQGRCFWTTSKRLADDVQELLLKIGTAGMISVDHPERKGSTMRDGRVIIHQRPCYIIYESINRFEAKLGSKMIEPYTGFVYCCEVPNHIIYVRRNGKTCWCGNSEFVTCHNHINPVLQALAVGPRALGTFPWRTLSLAPLGALALYLLR